MDIVKRLLCVVLVIVLLISACPIRLQAAAAETDTTITVASVNAKPGDTVHVAVRIAGNPGIMGATLMLNYDPKLTLTEAEGGEPEGFDEVWVRDESGKLVRQEANEDDVKEGQ